MAADAASVVEKLLSEGALVYFQTKLFTKYAKLWRGANPLRRPNSRSLAVMGVTSDRLAVQGWAALAYTCAP